MGHDRCCDGTAGPTACMASPEVMDSIKRQVRESAILSAADARLAVAAGMLTVPQSGRPGFNDEMIYPPEEAGPSRAAESGLSPSRAVAMREPKGTLNCLVLLVDFADNRGTKPRAAFEKLLFDAADPGSMRSFYRDLSYGALDVKGRVTDWIRADHPYSHYTAGASGTGNGFPRNVPGLLQEVLTKYCAANSIAPFDADGDGFIDGLFLVHAGGGAETEPDEAKRRDMIWSHKWVLPATFQRNGVRAFAYFTAPEDGRLGVFAHEFAHFLGLPDLYDTTYRSRGVGAWCLMAGGSWGGGGDAPARLSAWCLARLGWIKPKKASGKKTLQLPPIAGDKKACHRINIPGGPASEYFLIENRAKAGRDRELPAGGLAVWHVDESQSANTNPAAYRVAIVQADGKRDLELNRNGGDAGDIFPGRGGVTAVSGSATAHPNLRTNSGAATRLELKSIKVTGGTVSVEVKA